jgi:hypothetical protein
MPRKVRGGVGTLLGRHKQREQLGGKRVSVGASAQNQYKTLQLEKVKLLLKELKKPVPDPIVASVPPQLNN